MPYGLIKVDNITFTNAGSDQTISVSGLFASTSGNLTVTGTVSGNTIQGQTISGVTVTGTTANFTSGNFTNISGGRYTITSGVFAAGSAAAPSISFVSDPNTGIYSPGADQVAISTNGTGRLFVDASGNVGLVSAPSAFGTRTAIQLNGAVSNWFAGGVNGFTLFSRNLYNDGGNKFIGSSYASNYYQNTSGEHVFEYSSASGTAGAAATMLEAMRITNAGRLGLGTSSPAALCHLRSDANSAVTHLYLQNRNAGASAQSRIAFTDSANDLSDNRHAYIGAVTTGAGQNGSSFVIATNPDGGSAQERIWVSSAGNVGIGTTSPAYALDVQAGDVRFKRSASDDAAIYFGSTTNNYIFGSNTGNLFVFATNGSERARIDSSGRLLVGTSTASQWNHFSPDLPLQVARANSLDTAIQLTAFRANDQYGPNVIVGKSRSNTLGTNTAILDGDWLGELTFVGANGTSWSQGAGISARADGQTWANGDCPTRLVFSTTADGASSPTERVRVTSGGYFKASNAGTYQGVTDLSHELRQTGTSRGVIASASNASYADAVLTANVIRAANSAYNFLDGYSGDFGDLEVRLTGDGNGRCDGAWTGGGADYAEYFEWSDGNPNAEDRRGISVVLDGDRIRPAIAGEDPIGVISGNPSVVGDSAWNKWSGKYLRDDYGTYIQEDYEVVNDEGETVVQQRRKLNPAYDPDVEYTSREERPEWDCVGLMGKLRLRKGQPTGSRWIKMRDISDSVEEWLVR